jgi:hypothetical protein
MKIFFKYFSQKGSLDIKKRIIKVKGDIYKKERSVVIGI